MDQVLDWAVHFGSGAACSSLLCVAMWLSRTVREADPDVGKLRRARILLRVALVLTVAACGYSIVRHQWVTAGLWLFCSAVTAIFILLNVRLVRLSDLQKRDRDERAALRQRLAGLPPGGPE